VSLGLLALLQLILGNVPFLPASAGQVAALALGSVWGLIALAMRFQEGGASATLALAGSWVSKAAYLVWILVWIAILAFLLVGLRYLHLDPNQRSLTGVLLVGLSVAAVLAPGLIYRLITAEEGK
jgi:hypothetical protein